MKKRERGVGRKREAERQRRNSSRTEGEERRSAERKNFTPPRTVTMPSKYRTARW